MSRAHGKHTPRPPRIEADSPEGRQLGIGEHYENPLPGGRIHLENPPTHHEKPAVPEHRGEEFEGWLAHGVPPSDHGLYDRADLPGVQRWQYKPVYKKQPETIAPVPVIIVEGGGGGKAVRSAAPRHFSVPAAGSDPVHICGRDARRARVLLLNEDTASNIRFAQRPSDLTGGGGALLPYPTNSYLALHTQDDLYAVSADAGTPLLSVIQEFEEEGGG